MIDGDATGRLRPFEALTRAAPVSDQVPRLIELQNLGSRDAAACWGIEYRALFVIAQRIGASMSNPDVVLAVAGNTGTRTEDPMVWQRPGPQWVDIESGRLAPSLSTDRLLNHDAE